MEKNEKEYIEIDNEIFLIKKSKSRENNEIIVNDKEIINENLNPKKSSNKNFFAKTYVRNLIFVSCMILTFFTFYYAFVYPIIYKQFLVYREKVLPNTYLNNVQIDNKKFDELNIYIDDYINNLKNKRIVFTNKNGNYEYDLSDYNLSFNDVYIKNKIRNNSSFVSLVKRLFYGDKKQEYNIEFIKDVNYKKLISDIRKKVNVEKKNGVFIRDENYQLSFVGYRFGFILDEKKMDETLQVLLYDNGVNIELPGEVKDFNNIELLMINKNIVEFSTDYSGDISRKKNIELAVSKLNGTVLYPGDTFSYYKEVGPYNAKNGYYFYHDMVGSGVCQVSSTLYNVVLLSDLKIVYRAPHGKKVWYLPGGLDATVYGSYTDFKFKNSYDYPIYISAYTNNDNVYISLWSNNKVNENIYYKLRSIKTGNLSYNVYRDKYENNKLIKTEFINSTKYSSSY